MSTRDFSWSKGGRCVWLTTYHTCSAETSRKSEALIYPEPLGPSRPVAGDLYLYWRDNSIANYTCSIFLLDTWTLRAADQNYLESFEMWCWRRMEKISWTDHVRNEEVLLRVNEQRNILHELVTSYVETAF